MAGDAGRVEPETLHRDRGARSDEAKIAGRLRREPGESVRRKRLRLGEHHAATAE